MAVKWKWKPAAGGAVSPDLTNKVNQLETNTVKITGDQNIAGNKTFTTGIVSRSSTEFGTEIKAGFGGPNVKFIPEDNSTKTLQFYNGNPNDGRRFNLLIAEPTQANNPATKNYVDNRIQKRIIAQTINVNSTYTISPTSGYEIISVMVGRKRVSDSFYFFTHNVNLNFQVFLQNNDYKVYNNGNVNDFNNEYKIVVVEKKV